VFLAVRQAGRKAGACASGHSRIERVVTLAGGTGQQDAGWQAPSPGTVERSNHMRLWKLNQNQKTKMLTAPKAVMVASAICCAVLAGGGLTAPAFAASPADHAGHSAAKKTGVGFFFPDGGQVVVNKACRLSASGFFPTHKKENPNSVTNNCKLWLIIDEMGACLLVGSGDSQVLVPPTRKHSEIWEMSKEPVCF
jgi:hypothetical protein